MATVGGAWATPPLICMRNVPTHRNLCSAPPLTYWFGLLQLAELFRQKPNQMKPNQPYSWFAVVAVIKYMTHQDWDEVVPKSDGFTCANAVKGGWIHNTPVHL